MKYFFSLIFLIQISTYCNSQTEEEAKDFIKQQIETHSITSSYKQFAKFAADGELNEFDLLSAGFLPSELLHVIVVFEKLQNPSLGDVHLKTYAFNIREIKNIIVTSRENFTVMQIYFRNKSAVAYTKSVPNKEREVARLESALIYISKDQNLGDRIAKSFYFLCKKYGGTPIEK
jgi:hypothetical protein